MKKSGYTGKAFAEQGLGKTLLRIFMDGVLRKAAKSCFSSLFYNFFFRQYRAAFLKNIPVSGVDHELDEKIPFLPEYGGIYHDFTALWIRTAGFLIEKYPARKDIIADFINSIGKVYEYAAQVYAERLSTTARPRYIKDLRFIMIHLFDPHLMCIPSLHVMVVTRVYTKFAEITQSISDSESPENSETLAEKRRQLKQCALLITESVLYIKQHSVNCIAAALYAMNRFDAPLFSPDEARDFCGSLFQTGVIPQNDAENIRNYIFSLYKRFLEEGEKGGAWTIPLLSFLEEKAVPA